MKNNQKVYVCSHILSGEEDVKLVVHEDGDWMFLCGQLHEDDPSNYKVVGFGHISQIDPTLFDVIDLENNFEAERECVGSTWIKTNLNECH